MVDHRSCNDGDVWFDSDSCQISFTDINDVQNETIHVSLYALSQIKNHSLSDDENNASKLDGVEFADFEPFVSFRKY